MISQIAETVSAFFYSMDVIDEEEKGKSRYGIEIIISTIIGFGVIIISGILLSKTNLAIAYLICIVPIRMYTGGYHAKTYFKCNIVFWLLFLLNIFMFQYIVENELEIQLCITTLLSFYIIERFAPVENENKKLTSRQKKKYKKISIVLFIIYYFISILFLSKQIEYGVIILLVLDTVSILILEVKINETNKIQSIKKIANLSLFVAIMAAGTASFWGGHQPKEPKM